MKQWWMFLLVASVALSGCAKEEAQEVTQETQEASGATEVPQWAIGDYWTFTTTNAQGESGLNTYIVTGEQGGDWIVETDEDDQALYNARNEYSMMGPQRKSDLAGSQGSDRIQFFSWPLEDQKTWSTRWDGIAVDMTAHALEDGTFHIMAHAGEPMFAEYVYDPEVKWISQITWYDENETAQWVMELDDAGSGYTGSIIRYTFGDTLDFTANGGPAVIHENPSIDGEWNQIAVTAVFACNGDGQGMIIMGVNSASEDPRPVPMFPTVNEPEYGNTMDCSQGDSMVDRTIMQNIGGEWEVGVVQSTPNGVAHLFLEQQKRESIAFPFE